ncbi:uncharacterized protein CLUP02_01448 [Colletotrichum lupini]|uniref:Uncharacterized protein n=1 Tax=Colletotrichum lupini TaxID=145971 RepID=A0A9Q8W9A9_9PEZI|nr:uncharacterized protein CLUP02_01448 [Colletotrichum lupini]UQC74796.1 hypothetical protein CLUP02_01448 [Colletotrichum lupini]
MTCHAAFWAFSRVTCTTNFHTIPKRGFVAKSSKTNVPTPVCVVGRASPTSISFGFLNVNAVSEGAAKSETERPALELRKRSWTKRESRYRASNNYWIEFNLRTDERHNKAVKHG